MLTPEDVSELTAPFAANEHEFLRGMTYLTEYAITNRLDYVDPSWEFMVTRVEYSDERVSVFASLTILGVTRASCGTDKLKGGVGEPEKSATTDALKRCARLFGIGRYILNLPDSVKDVNAMDRWLRVHYGAPDGTPVPAKAPPAPVNAHAFDGRKPDTRKKQDTAPKETLQFMCEPYVEAGIGKSGKPYIRFEITGRDEYAYAFSRDVFRQQGWAVDGWMHEGDTGRTKHLLDKHPMVTAERDGEMWKVTHATAYDFCDAVEIGKTA